MKRSWMKRKISMTTSRGVRGLDDLFSTIGKTRAAISGVVLMVMLASGMPSLAAEDSDLAEEPRKVIEETVSQIIAILARKDESAEFRIHEIERIAYDVFDFTTMSKLVLARKWRKLSKDQKGELVGGVDREVVWVGAGRGYGGPRGGKGGE
jgi:hypothetical protein